MVDYTGPKLFVGRLYKCSLLDHYIRTTDVRIMQQCPRFSQDILISHKLIIKTEYMGSLMQSIANGMSFIKVRNQIEDIIVDTMALSSRKFLLDCAISNIEVDMKALDAVKEVVLNLIPSKQTFEDIFKSWFFEQKFLMEQAMMNINSTDLMVDHTFKVSSSMYKRKPFNSNRPTVFGRCILLMGLKKQQTGLAGEQSQFCP